MVPVPSECRAIPVTQVEKNEIAEAKYLPNSPLPPETVEITLLQVLGREHYVPTSSSEHINI